MSRDAGRKDSAYSDNDNVIPLILGHRGSGITGVQDEIGASFLSLRGCGPDPTRTKYCFTDINEYAFIWSYSIVYQCVQF